MRASITGFVVLVVALVACGKSKEQREKEQKTGAIAELDKARPEITALVDVVTKKALGYTTPLAADKVDGVKMLDVGMNGNALEITEWEMKALVDNADRTHPDNYVTPSGIKVGAFWPAGGAYWFEDTWKWLHDPSAVAPAWDTDSAEQFLHRVRSLDYVMVVRVFDFKFPKLNESRTAFEGGSVSGEVRIFDVRGKDHGGVRFEVESLSKVKVEPGRNEDSALLEDMSTSARTAVYDSLGKQIEKVLF